MWTIWGRAHQQLQLAPCIWSVDTPSHGGIVLTEEAAAEQLSPACMEFGEHARGYVFFEEDVHANLILLELPWLIKKYIYWKEVSEEEILQTCIRMLNLFAPDFLSYHHIPLNQEYTERCLKRLLENYMREHRHPELIVSASGTWSTGLDGIGIAITADGQHHLIDLQRYAAAAGVGPRLLRDSETIVPPGGL